MSIGRHSFTILHAILALFVPFIACAQESVVLQLKWKHQFQSAGFYAAIEQGYYRAAGLDVTLVEGGPDTEFAVELASNRAQYAVAPPSMILRRAEGRPVVALAVLLQHSPEILITRMDSGINNPHQIVNRSVMMSAEDTPCVLAMLKNEAVPTNTIRIVPYSFDLEKLIRGEVDAIGGYITDEPAYFKQRGVPVNIIQPRNYGVDFYGDCLFTSEQELARHPKRVRAFLHASLQGWQYALRNVDEMVTLIQGKYRSVKSREALLYEAEQIAEIMFPELIQVGHMNPGRWEYIARTYVRLGMLAPNYSLDGFLYEPKQRTFAWVWWVIGITGGSTLLLTGIVVSLTRLNRRIATAERSARESHLLLQTILDTIPVGVFWKDSQSTYLGGNRIFSEAAGLASPDQLRGLRDANLPWKADAERYQAEDKTVLSTGQPLPQFEESLEKADGGQMIFHRFKIPLRDSRGHIFGVLGVLQDVTRLKESEARHVELQERMQESQKFESLHRLTGGVSHHFNNILQGILGYAELAANAREDTETVRGYINEILVQTQRAMDMSRVLRVSIGFEFYQMRRINLPSFVIETRPLVAALLKPGQTIRLVNNEPEIFVQADIHALRQILTNLILNASEAMHSGEVLIHTGSISCDRSYLSEPYLAPDLPEGKYAFLDVIDHGEGIAPKTMKMVFDPFFSTRAQGRGLGMAIVLGIVKSHRGAIKINSLSGRGTTVRVLLPVRQ